MSQSRQKSGSAIRIKLNCTFCPFTQSFWSVGGKYKEKIQVGDQQIHKRNELLYASILGGRLIGIGHSKIEMYHSALSIPAPCSRKTFTEAQSEVITADEYIAKLSMDHAVEELRLLENRLIICIVFNYLIQ